eukprot:GILJ01012965.1.p1 GENE.GILJ01012965.1~~GILJ01012965.1.p1  ORF type:complete len:403 (+),score=36.15 GILJ01012965.1:109-1317(+)
MSIQTQQESNTVNPAATKNGASSHSSSLPYYFVFLVPFLLLPGYYFLNNTWIVVWFGFGLLPVLDLIMPVDTVNHFGDERRDLEQDFKFRIPLYVWIVVEYFVLFWSLYQTSNWSGTTMQFIGLVISMGITTGGIGLTVAHELFHKMHKMEQFLGKLLLVPVVYMHFCIEHVHGHHRNVATPNDPASALQGQTLYQFYPQSVVGSIVHCWNDEKERLMSAKLPVWSTHNQMIWFVVIPSLTCWAITMVFGWTACLFFLAQAWVGFSLLELINYVEHYGLRRKELSPGVYEKVTIEHSWNSPHIATNYFLFKLQRHSDHHANALKPYQALNSYEQSPQLPTGYAGMSIAATVPFVWRAVMDPILKAYKDKDTTMNEQVRAGIRTLKVFLVVVSCSISYAVFCL